MQATSDSPQHLYRAISTITHDSCNLIGPTGFRVEPKQSGPKVLDPPFPVQSRESIHAGENSWG